MDRLISESTSVYSRRNRLARSTHVSRLVKDYEALASRTGPEHTAAAVMPPVRALPDADQVISMLSRRSVRDMKEAIEARICSAPSGATVVVGVTPVLALPDADQGMLSRRSVRDMKEAIEARICPASSDPSVVVGVTPVRILALPDADQGMLSRRSVRDMKLEIEARSKPTPSIGKPQKTVGTIQPTQPELVGDSAGESTDPAAGDLLREVVDKVILKAQKPGRSRSSSLPPAPKSAGVKKRKEGRSRSLGRLDDVTADFLKLDLLPTLKKVVLKAEKPYRSRSLPPTPKSAGVKQRKEGRSRSLGRLDDVTADFLKSDLLPTRSDVAGKSTPSVYPTLKLQKPGRSRSLPPTPKSASVKQRKEDRSRSLSRLDDVDLAADFLKSDLLPTLFLDKAEAGKASVLPTMKLQKPGRAHSADAARAPRKPAASKPLTKVRAASLTRLDDVKVGVVSPKEILSSLLVDAVSSKAWSCLKPKKPVRSHSADAARTPRKPAASKLRKEVRAASLTRLDDVKAGVVSTKEILSSLLDAASAAKAWAGLAPRKPVRSHSADAARTPRKPAASKLRKEVRAASLTRLDDVKAGVVSTKEILSSLLDAASAAKVWAGLTPKKPPRARSFEVAPRAARKPSASKPRKVAVARALSLSRLDDLAADVGVRIQQEELMRSLCMGRASTKASVILKKEKPGRARSLAAVPATNQSRRARARSLSVTRIKAKRGEPVKPADLLKTLCLGDGTGKARITRKLQQVDTASTKPLADAAARAPEGTPVLQPPTKPSRFKEYVLYRNNFGHFGFSLLTTLTPDLERVHIVFQAADSIDVLPVGRLLAVNFLPVQGKTTEELYDIFNRSPESVRLKILPLYFPLPVLQEMVSDQVSPVTYQDHIEYFVSQGRVNPVKKWVKKKLRGLVSTLTRCRNAFTCCWGR